MTERVGAEPGGGQRRALPALPAVLRAPAKLTRSLRVTGVRRDGYHLLEAEMISLDLADTIELSEGEGLEVIDGIDWSGEVRSPEASGGGPLGAPGSNLVELALGVAGRRAHVRLIKAIPAGAGLGGGSSDAAAVLRWAGCGDLTVAARLGADVPFCLRGGRALVGGIGELIEALPALDRVFLLVTPNVVVPTPAVYAAWDELGGPEGDHGNDLEPAALAVAPGIRWWRDLMAAAVGERPHLAGSGGTWFVDRAPEGRDRLIELAAQVRAEIVAARESALITIAVPDSSS